MEYLSVHRAFRGRELRGCSGHVQTFLFFHIFLFSFFLVTFLCVCVVCVCGYTILSSSLHLLRRAYSHSYLQQQPQHLPDPPLRRLPPSLAQRRPTTASPTLCYPRSNRVHARAQSTLPPHCHTDPDSNSWAAAPTCYLTKCALARIENYRRPHHHHSEVLPLLEYEIWIGQTAK